MSAESQSPAAQRGKVLIEQRRYADAERYFRQALANEPNDVESLYFLALSQLQQNRADDGLQTIASGIALEPEASELHALKAGILSQLRKPKEAMAAAQTAVELAPDSDYALTARASVWAAKQEWRKAEEDARKALELNPENSGAANLLAHTLRLQNRQGETADQIAYMLSRDPEDADTQSAAGWAALQRGDHKAAETHFLEALRLEANNEAAREGLKEAFKARSPIYRLYLSYCFFMQRFTAGKQWLIIIGLIVGVRVARAVLPPPLALAVIVFYFLFVLWVHVARAVGNFQLSLDRFARHALSRAETWEAWCVGGGVILGLPLFVLGISLGWEIPLIVGLGLVALSFPLAYVFTNQSHIGRWVFGGAAVVVACSAVAVLLPSVFGKDLSAGLGGIGLLAVVAVTWLANVPALNRRG